MRCHTSNVVNTQSARISKPQPYVQEKARALKENVPARTVSPSADVDLLRGLDMVSEMVGRSYIRLLALSLTSMFLAGQDLIRSGSDRARVEYKDAEI